MANHKLQIDDFEEIDYTLIAIHTALEDFRLAYFINKNLPVHLAKNKNEVQIYTKDTIAFFSRFDFDDIENSAYFCLIKNQTKINEINQDSINSLFATENQTVATMIYLVPDFKKADYFLKIENQENTIEIDQIIRVLKSINRLSMVYTIDLNKIKNKNNLIF